MLHGAAKAGFKFHSVTSSLILPVWQWDVGNGMIEVSTVLSMQLLAVEARRRRASTANNCGFCVSDEQSSWR
jgi:hypothetical protein